MKQKTTEADLAKEVVAFLTEMGWEVYQEVEGPGGRCDIVAVRGKIHWAIECKLSLGLSVMEQAYNWIQTGTAHYVSIATPKYVGGNLAGVICRQYGIGTLFVKYEEVREQTKPRLHRRARGFKLHEAQKTFCEAGSNKGGHWTPFKQTVRELINMVRNEPGVEFNRLIKALDHHYSSYATAKSCLRGFIGTHVIPELRIETVGNKLCVFPADSSDNKAAA